MARGAAAARSIFTRRKIGLVLWILVALGLVIGFRGYLRWMWFGWFPAWSQPDLSVYDRFVNGDSYYTHGPIVVLTSLVLLLLVLRRDHIPLAPRRGAGLVLVGLGLLFHLMACAVHVQFIRGFLLLGILLGVVVYFLGFGALRKLWFPLCILLLAMPLSHVTIAGTTFKLRVFAADAGVYLANLVGLAAERLNNTILLLQNKSMTVADTCSGMRTLISLLAFGAIYAYLCRMTRWWKLLLFLSAVPIGVVSNCLRMASVIVVAHFWDVETATGFFHDSSGIVIFVLTFLLMFGVEKSVLWFHRAIGRPMKERRLPILGPRDPQAPGQAARMAASAGGFWGVVLAAVMLAAGFGARHLETRRGGAWLGQISETVFTLGEIEVAGQRYIGQRGEVPRRIKQILRTEDVALVRYVSASQASADLWLIYSQDDRMATHAPEVCITANGGIITQGRNVTVENVEGPGRVPCRELLVEDQYGRSECVLYTLNAGQRYTSSIWMQQLMIVINSLLGRMSNSALIRVDTPVDGQDVSAARQRAADFMRLSIESFDRVLNAHRHGS